MFNCMNYERRTMSYVQAASPRVHLAPVNAALQQRADWPTQIPTAAAHRRIEKIAVPTHAQNNLRKYFYPVCGGPMTAAAAFVGNDAV